MGQERLSRIVNKGNDMSHLKLQKKSIDIFKFFIFVAAFQLLSLFSWSHSGGGGGSSQSHKDEIIVKRVVQPGKYRVLTSSEINHFKKKPKEIPADIIIATCRIESISVCRGISVGLFEGENLIKKSRTGFDGSIGFQGLHAGRGYLLKIEGQRYSGEVMTQSGRIVDLKARRKIDQSD